MTVEVRVEINSENFIYLWQRNKKINSEHSVSLWQRED